MSAYDEGRKAFAAGIAWTENPYPKMSSNYCDWVDGWFDQKKGFDIYD